MDIGSTMKERSNDDEKLITRKSGSGSGSDDDDDDDDDDEVEDETLTTTTTTHSVDDHVNDGADLSGEAAGVVRGVSRSIVRAPLIGRLPRPAATSMPKVPKMPVKMPKPTSMRLPKSSMPKSSMPKPIRVPKPSSSSTRGILRRKVPARQVARVSDRVSTGWDWYTSALEVDESAASTTKTQQWLLRARSFSWNLFKNTLLGMAVFEGYGYVVGSLAPPPRPLPPILNASSSHDENVHDDGVVLVPTTIIPTMDPPQEAEESSSSSSAASSLLSYLPFLGDDDDDDELSTSSTSTSSSTQQSYYPPDEYSRASLPVHFLAGTTAGVIHGLASTVMEQQQLQGNSNGLLSSSSSMIRHMTLNTIHHGMAHAMLFGSYETIKRAILGVWTTTDDSIGTPAHTNNSRTHHLLTFGLAGGLAGQGQHLVSHVLEEAFGLSEFSSTYSPKLDPSSVWRRLTLPPLRPLLLAFPPSAIGFIAFEYGKQFGTP